MSWLSVNINNDDAISTRDQGVEKGYLAVTFGFDGKRDGSRCQLNLMSHGRPIRRLF